ncbi:hypothetical protein MHYP_G00306990 [Metynnis hypsauchen]
MNSQIIKVTQSLTTAEETRNQNKLIMQPYANLEECLTTAPLSIAILGELIFISCKADVSINKNPPNNSYKYIKCPDSFHACLMQVCNSGWWTFNEAHKNMDQIWLHTMAVPDYMKIAVKILFQGGVQHCENQKKILFPCLRRLKLFYNAKLFSKDLLYIQAFQAANIASLVHMISATYTEVSKYPVGRVSLLVKLMAMDKEKTEFEQERLQLQNSCDEAQKDILHLVLENKYEFNKTIDKTGED